MTRAAREVPAVAPLTDAIPGGWLLLIPGALVLVFVLLAPRRSGGRYLAGHRQRTGASLLVLVRNQERQIEGFLRLLAYWAQRTPGLGPTSEILAVDLGSADDTPAILARLSGRIAGLRVVYLGADAVGRGAQETALFECAHKTVFMLDLVDVSDVRPVLRSLRTGLAGGAPGSPLLDASGRQGTSRSAGE